MALVGSIGRTVAALAALVTVAHAEDVNDYPTSARVEYVFGCLKANGETRQAIEQCSCSIDIVASLVPYARYVTAETVLSMSQVREIWAGSSAHRSRRQARSTNSGGPRPKRKCAVSEALHAGPASNPGIVDLHSRW